MPDGHNNHGSEVRRKRPPAAMAWTNVNEPGSRLGRHSCRMRRPSPTDIEAEHVDPHPRRNPVRFLTSAFAHRPRSEHLTQGLTCNMAPYTGKAAGNANRNRRPRNGRKRRMALTPTRGSPSGNNKMRPRASAGVNLTLALGKPVEEILNFTCTRASSVRACGGRPAGPSHTAPRDARLGRTA